MVRKAGKYQSSKENCPRFLSEGLWPWTSFALCAYTVHELRNSNASEGKIDHRSHTHKL